MWAGNKYLLPIKSYIESPTTKQTGKREILLSFWGMTSGFKGLVTFSDVTVNTEKMLKKKKEKGKNNKNCIFYVKIPVGTRRKDGQIFHTQDF